MRTALILLVSMCPAALLSAISEGSFIQTYASSIAPYINDNAVAGEIRMDDSALLRYQSIKSPKEKGIVVLFGGHSESYVKYAELFYDLRDMGITFYALDQRGQGFSTRMLPDRERDYIPDYERYLTDLNLFMKSVVHARADEKVFLFGHSLGGAVAAAYAERYPKEINGLVLSSPYLGSKTGSWPRSCSRRSTSSVGVESMYPAEDHSALFPSSRIWRRIVVFDMPRKCRTIRTSRQFVSDFRQIAGW